MLSRLVIGLVLATVSGLPATSAEVVRHGIAMHGEPALPADFTHFPYVDPTAPKGGRVILGQVGTFDSLNPFIVKGVVPSSIRGFVYESLQNIQHS